MTEHQHSSADRAHVRGDVEQPDQGPERESPESGAGGPTARGEHPIEPAEGARQPGESGGSQGQHPIEPAEGSRAAAEE